MKNILRVFKNDLNKIHNNVIAMIVIMGILVIPTLYAWFNIAASWDPYSNTGNLKVAVASADEGYEGSLIPIEINIGDKVLSALRENTQMEWVFTTEEKATSGVKSGKYYAAIVIPKDFSNKMMSVFSEKVEKPELKLNDGTWYGRDNDKKSVVKITVKDGEVATEAVSGADSGESYDTAVEKAKYKATYGDFSHYEKADPGKFAGGSGTAEDPYRISNEAQLRYLSYSINADVNWSDTYFVQTADITLTGGDWQPIGWALNGEVNGKKTQVCAYPFKGNFDGGNYTIRGLAIGTETNPADQMTSGLFGLTAGTLNTNEKITESDKVVRLSNIHLGNIYINAATRYETYTGGLVGSGQTGIFIDNCSVTGKINVTTSESFARAGGLGASVLRGAALRTKASSMYRSEMGETQNPRPVRRAV